MSEVKWATLARHHLSEVLLVFLSNSATTSHSVSFRLPVDASAYLPSFPPFSHPSPPSPLCVHQPSFINLSLHPFINSSPHLAVTAVD